MVRCPVPERTVPHGLRPVPGYTTPHGLLHSVPEHGLRSVPGHGMPHSLQYGALQARPFPVSIQQTSCGGQSAPQHNRTGGAAC